MINLSRRTILLALLVLVSAIGVYLFVFTDVLSVKQPGYTPYYPEYNLPRNLPTSTVMAFVSTTQKESLKYKLNDGVNYVLVLKSELDKKKYEGAVIDWDKLNAKDKQELLKEYDILVERFDQTSLATLKLNHENNNGEELQVKKVLLRKLDNGLWESIAEFYEFDYVSAFVFGNKLYFSSDYNKKIYSYDLKTKEKKLFFHSDQIGFMPNAIHDINIKTIGDDVYLYYGFGIFWIKSSNFSSGKFNFLSKEEGPYIQQDDNGRYWIKGSWGGYVRSFDPITKKIGRKFELVSSYGSGEFSLGKTKNGEDVVLVDEDTENNFGYDSLSFYTLKDLYIFNYDKWTSSTIMTKGMKYPIFNRVFYNPNYNEIVFVAADGVYRYSWVEKQIKKIDIKIPYKIEETLYKLRAGNYGIVDGNLKFCNDEKGGFVLNFKDNSVTYFDHKDESCCEGCRYVAPDNGMLDDAPGLPSCFKVILLE